MTPYRPRPDGALLLCGAVSLDGPCDAIVALDLEGDLYAPSHLIEVGPGRYRLSAWNLDRVRDGKSAHSRRPRFHRSDRRFPGVKGTADVLVRGRASVRREWGAVDWRKVNREPLILPCAMGHENEIDAELLGA